jgi:hypothetical protein
MPPKPAADQDAMYLKAAMYAAGAVVLVYALVPGLVAFGIYFFLRGYFSKRDYVLLLLGGSVVSLIGLGNGLMVEYVRWVNKLLPPGSPSLYFSLEAVVAIVMTSALLLGAVGLLDGTSIGAKIPSFFKPSALGEKPSIIPTAREKQRIRSVPTPVFDPQSMGMSLDGVGASSAQRFVVMGKSSNGTPTGISEQEIGTHALVFGSTGSGKTETIKTLAGGLLDLGWEGIVLDLKEDTKPGGLKDWCEEYAQSHAVVYQELRLSDPTPRFWFDTLDGLTRDEARDTILSLTRFDDDYYKQQSVLVLGQLLKLLYWAHEADPTTCPLPTIRTISNILGSASGLAAETKKFRAIVMQNTPGLPKEEFQVLESPQQVHQQQAHSWGAKLGNLYDTQAGRSVLSQPGPSDRRPKLDVTQGGLIYIGLDSQGKPDLTRIVSSSVLQRISVEAAQRTTGMSQNTGKKKFLIVDEANWVDRTIVQNLLSRARSAGIAMVLCTQGPKDWIDKDGNDFAKLAQNTNVAMIMKQGEPESAQLCADFIGNTEYMSASIGIEGGGTLRKETENIVSQDELRGLGVGEMILRVSTPYVRTEWVQVSQRDPKLVAGYRDSGPGLARPPI